MCLTFDDGPHPVHTPRILDELARRDVKAMFFVVGERLESEVGQALMKRAHREGHVIANHTYSHPNLTKLLEEEIRREPRRTQELIGDCAHELRLFRPPFGATNLSVNRIVQDEGYMSVLWNVDTLDRKKRDGS